MAAIITLLTDFGGRDSYVASMKGVILGINPAAIMVDISHEVRPQQVFEGGMMLRGAYRYFPPGTIHVAVVDPGVGSERRCIAVTGGGYKFVGPDNGIFGLVYPELHDLKVYHLTNQEFFRAPVSETFHGRDVFAPVAAHISTGVPPQAMGPEVKDQTGLPFPLPDVEEESISGEVVYTDSFGNLITNIERSQLARLGNLKHLRAFIGNDTLVRLCGHYQEVKCGEPLALIGSGDFLEIAVREGSARALLMLKEGDKVLVTKEDEQERS
jgi:S-adenosylmethionine hydrolase